MKWPVTEVAEVHREGRRTLYSATRLRRAMTQFIGGRIVQALGQIALVLVLVRVLPVHEFGLYMLVIGLSEMLLLAASLGGVHVARRYLPLLVTRLPMRRLLVFVALLASVHVAVLCSVCASLWLLWPAVSALIGLGEAEAAAAKPALFLVLLLPAMRFACEMLDSLLEQGKARLVEALAVFGRLSGIGILVLASTSIGIGAVIAVDIVVLGIAMLLAWMLLIGSLLAHGGGGDGEIPWREIARFASCMGPVDVMGSSASPGALRLVLANTLGVVESGLFAFLQSIQNVVGRYLPGTLLRGIVMPVLVARSDTSAGRTTVERGASLFVKSNLMVVAGGSVIIALAGDDLVSLLSGGRFREAGTTLLLMYLGLAVISQRVVIEMVMQITGQVATLRATAALSPIALVVVWMVSGYGLDAAVIVLIAFASIANGIATTALMRSPGGFALEWRGQVVIAVAAVVAIGIGIALDATVAGLAVALPVALAVFLLPVLAYRPFTLDELSLVEKAVGVRFARMTLGPFSGSACAGAQSERESGSKEGT